MTHVAPQARQQQAISSIATPSLQRGDQIGPYRIVQALGADDIGTRYRVKTPCENELPGMATITVLHPAVVDDNELQCAILDDVRRRFKIHSSNVIQTLGIRRDEFVYLIAQWVDGPSARRLKTYVERFKNSSPPAPETLWWPRIALKIVIDSVRGLDAIHSSRNESGAPLGLLHSNIAAENILVDRDGIARLSASLQACLRRKLMQLEAKKINSNEPANPDQLSDIQAIGYTLLELLVERGDQPACSQASGDAADMRPPLLSGLPLELADLLLKATHRDPARRFQSASELEIALERLARKHHLIATAGDVARFVRRYTEWEMESKTMVRASSSNPPPLCHAVEPEAEPALEATIIDSTLALPQPCRVVQPPPLPPRQRTSAQPVRCSPPPPPRRTVEVASSDLEPGQSQVLACATTQAVTQPILLRTVRQLTQGSAPLLLAWLLAGTALLGVSSTAVALYQRRFQGVSDAKPLVPPAVHEARSTTPVKIVPDDVQPPTNDPPVPATRNESVDSAAVFVQSMTAVDAAKPRGASVRFTNTETKSKKFGASSLRSSEIRDPWSR